MWRKRSASGNHIRDLFTGLLEDRGSSECFRYELSIKMKTGNMEDILNANRQSLVSVGLGGGSLVPSFRHIKRATSVIMKLFVTICEPERTYSGFRVNLLRAVTFASLVLLQKTKLEGLKIDIWGNCCKIGGVEVTRLTFRILNTTVSSQSSKAVFCFASYRGKDGRYAMEQNFGPSQLPIYVCDDIFLPICCSDVDGRRTSLKIPFRQHVPREALASIIDVRTVCPDATHMITRCTENDIRSVAQKVIINKHPWEALSIQRFEKNLTTREAKRPSFQFNITHKNVGKTPGTVGPLSLAGSNALTVIAETEKLRSAQFGTITNLYDGVWTTEILLGSEDGYN